MDNNLQWCLDQMKNELKNINNNYVGNIKFQINVFKGGISNICVITEKSIKNLTKSKNSI